MKYLLILICNLNLMTARLKRLCNQTIMCYTVSLISVEELFSTFLEHHVSQQCN